MARRTLILVLVLVAAGFLYYGYNTYDAKRAGAAGAVYTLQTPAAKESAQEQSQPPSPTESTTYAHSGENLKASQAEPQATEEQPSSDTLNPNPPNGMAFSGSGKYQVYRQGDLTWRLDTETGKACVLFATEAEWKKPLVYRHRCNNSK